MDLPPQSNMEANIFAGDDFCTVCNVCANLDLKIYLNVAKLCKSIFSSSGGKFRDKMKPSLQNASFRPPFAAVVPFRDRKKCLNHTLFGTS